VSHLEWPRRVAALGQFRVDDPQVPVLGRDDEHHLRTVLRARSGEEIVATDGRGSWSLCEVGDVGLHRVTPVHVDPPTNK
jgi:16S rRNA U1498 N3-methylase RsmE